MGPATAGGAPAPVNAELQQRVLEGGTAITCRPADLLEPELAHLTGELHSLAEERSIELSSGDREIDDVLTYALFTQVGLKFLKNRGNADAFEPPPDGEADAAVVQPQPVKGDAAVYTVTVNGQRYVVEVADGGDVTALAPAAAAAPTGTATGVALSAPLAGNIIKLNVAVGDVVAAGDVLVILEAMKMETEVRAVQGGTIASIDVFPGDAVTVGQPLLNIA